jgi:hypothetical protein
VGGNSGKGGIGVGENVEVGEEAEEWDRTSQERRRGERVGRDDAGSRSIGGAYMRTSGTDEDGRGGRGWWKYGGWSAAEGRSRAKR